MTATELVAANVRHARVAAGLDQAALGEKLKKYLGDAWGSKQAVSAAENGDRQFRPGDVLALSKVLGRSPGWFYAVHQGAVYGPRPSRIELRAGKGLKTIPAAELAELETGDLSSHVLIGLDDIVSAASHLRSACRNAAETLQIADSLAESVEGQSRTTREFMRLQAASKKGSK